VVPEAWEVSPRPIEVPLLATYHVLRTSVDARLRLDRLGPGSRQIAELTFTNGFDARRTTLLRLMAPAAACDRREGVAPRVDGSLEEWSALDALHEGKLVRMLSRPAAQRQALEFAEHNASVYSGWTNLDLHLAFRLEGFESKPGGVARSHVESGPFRRAWGEDLAQFIMQPVYADQSVGPSLHIICRPGGQMEVEVSRDPRKFANPWAPVVGVRARYAATASQGIWRGEVAVPWDLLNDEKHAAERPVFLRFNFATHRQSDGESASWAGPIDYGRDDSFTGLLLIRDERSSGMEPRP